jgi:mRNA-degrading endonuclease toxin of MazEF toxin-antitoxin module
VSGNILPETKIVRRGEIWTAKFGQADGADISGVQFVVVVSNNHANRHSNRVQVVPIGFRQGRTYPCEADITMKRSRQQKAAADRIQTIPKDRLIAKIGRVGRRDMADLERAIMLQLGLMRLPTRADATK